jgi:S-formylglutathione hydrolase FrmB
LIEGTEFIKGERIMAFFEFNALSVVMCGSFAARIFIPEMDRLQLDDKEHTIKYPVLLLLHDSGGAAVDWQQTPAERCAAENGIFIIAPDVQHALGTDMEYGPKYETFISGELLRICCNLFPISQDPAYTWIGGVGTGAYGAVKTAIHHPEVFSQAISIDGILDMGAIIKKALAGEETGIHHDAASLGAVFGELNQFKGSHNDLFALADRPVQNKFLFLCQEDNSRISESIAIAGKLKTTAKFVQIPSGADSFSQQQSLPMAIRWACAEKETL